jgi:acyl-coenzyme A synthetase/AMP-(fatty) acid ligase
MICLLGRQGDVIESGGNKISPSEIEDVALTCEIIEDCACIPVDNELVGKEPKLFVVIKKGYEFDYVTIYQFLSGHLEKYKVPRIIEQIDVIPRTFNGKIKRSELR